MSRPKGFTLIELLVVIAILALLSSVVLASLNTAREKGRLGAGRQFEANVYHAEADQAVGIWDFDDCTAPDIPAISVIDSSGNGNNGIPVSSPLWSSDTPTGKGCSLSFNGTAQYVDVGNAPSLNMGSAFTVSACVKIPSAPAAIWGFILAGSTNDFGVGIRSNLGGILGLTKMYVADAPLPNKTISLNTWHHVAVVFSANTITYFLNGQAIANGPFIQTFVASGKRIGTSGLGSYFFAGLMDNVRLYAKDFTADEVGKLYASEAPRFNVAVNTLRP